MKHPFFRVVPFFIVLGTLLSLVSCGSGDSGEGNETGQTVTDEQSVSGKTSDQYSGDEPESSVDNGAYVDFGTPNADAVFKTVATPSGISSFNDSKILENAIKTLLYKEIIFLENKEIMVNEDLQILDDRGFTYTLKKRRTGFVSDYDNAPEYLEDQWKVQGTWDAAKPEGDKMLVRFNMKIIQSLQSEYPYEPGYYEYNDETSKSKILEVQFGANSGTEAVLKNDQLDFYHIGTQRKLTMNDLKDYQDDQLAFLRNEFYARKGYKFKTKRMQDYFGEMGWYKPEFDDVTDQLSDLELENIYFIKGIEETRKLVNSGDRSALISKIYETGTQRAYTTSDLKDLTAPQLAFLRNEFFARKGYIFVSKKYDDYFRKQSWYNPQHKEVKHMLSDLEKQNVDFVFEREEQLK